MKNKNILEICLSPDLGGLEIFMTNCFKYFKTKTNCKVIVQQNQKLDAYLEDEEVSYIKREKYFPIKPALELAHFIDNHDIDIVHFHWTKDILTVVLAKFFSSKKPKIVQTRNMNMTRFKSDFYHKWLYKNITLIHAVTYQVKSQLEKFIPQAIRPKIEVVYMGTKEQEVDNKKVEELKNRYNLQDNFVVGIVGRIEEVKGQYLVIEAIEKLKDLNIKALIIGHTMDEEYLSGLEQSIADKQIEDKVIFTGFTKDVSEHMKLCDTLVLATTRETFGLVVIEAMINRVCVIATNAGGPTEIIEDKKDGLLFNREFNNLADKIELLYKDEKLKNFLSNNGYNRAKEKFNSDIQLEKLLKSLEEM